MRSEFVEITGPVARQDLPPLVFARSIRMVGLVWEATRTAHQLTDMGSRVVTIERDDFVKRQRSADFAAETFDNPFDRAIQGIGLAMERLTNG